MFAEVVRIPAGRVIRSNVDGRFSRHLVSALGRRTHKEEHSMRVTFTDVSTEDMQRVREALTAGFEGGEEDAGELRSNTGAAIEYAYRPDREELALEVHHFPALVKEGHLIGDLYNLVNK